MDAKLDNQRFIPFRKKDLIEMCLRTNDLSIGDQNQFRTLCHAIQSCLHHEFQFQLEKLKDVYAPINPDIDINLLDKKPEEYSEQLPVLLENILLQANYDKVSDQEIDHALEQESLFKIRLHVNFDDFDEILLFARGKTKKTEEVKSFFGLRSKEIEFWNYDRVVVFIRLKKDIEGSDSQVLFKPGMTLLKLFRNVPVADLEMLFPNTEVKMKLLDKMLIGIPAALSGVIVITTKLGAPLLLLGSLFGFWLGLHADPVHLDQTKLLVLVAGAGTLGAYLWKQFSNFKNRKIKFMKTLAENLYFKNLDNNAGVFFRLVNDAEEEECKETFIGYYFLLISDSPLSQISLNDKVNHWLMETEGCHRNFEAADALAKLKRFGLVKKVESDNGSDEEFYVATPLEEARNIMEAQWKKYLEAPGV